VAATRCDRCNRRVRPGHHELRLTDPSSGQLVGRYHTRPACQEAATKYLTRGTVLVASFIHPDRCGPNQQYCDAGLTEDAA
jgi:hypothetical protein